jgi:hypothetical protein
MNYIQMRAVFGVSLLLITVAGSAGCGQKETVLRSAAQNMCRGQRGCVALEWQPVTKDTTGSPVTGVGYKIHYGSQSGVHPNVVDVGQVTRSGVGPLTPGQYYFVVTAYVSGLGESDPSNEATGGPIAEVAPFEFSSPNRLDGLERGSPLAQVIHPEPVVLSMTREFPVTVP